MNSPALRFQKPVVFLIGGNRGAGKNTFASVLRTPSDQDTEFKFNVFTSGVCIFTGQSRLSRYHVAIEDSVLSRTENYVELSFARVLKEHVATLLGIPFDEVEAMKDLPLSSEILEKYSSEGGFEKQTLEWFQQPESSSPTLRDILIDVASKILKNDPQFYARTLFEQMIQPTLGKPNPAIFLITDWRYKAEYKFYMDLKLQGLIELLTCRVISDTAPSVHVPSERDLDDFSPNFIVQPCTHTQSPVYIFNDTDYHLFHCTG